MRCNKTALTHVATVENVHLRAEQGTQSAKVRLANYIFNN